MNSEDPFANYHLGEDAVMDLASQHGGTTRGQSTMLPTPSLKTSQTSQNNITIQQIVELEIEFNKVFKPHKSPEIIYNASPDKIKMLE